MGQHTRIRTAKSEDERGSNFVFLSSHLIHYSGQDALECLRCCLEQALRHLPCHFFVILTFYIKKAMAFFHDLN